MTAIVGGAKVSTKLDLLEQPDQQGRRRAGDRRRHGQHLPACRGLGVGKSLAEKDLAETANDIRDKAGRRALRHYPAHRRHGRLALGGQRTAPLSWRRSDGSSKAMILDARPGLIERIKGAIDEATTVAWNGLLGAFELQPSITARSRSRNMSLARTKAGKVRLGGRWRRHRRGPRPCRGEGPVHLCLHLPAAPSSSGWKARPCPASEALKGRIEAPHRRPAGRRPDLPSSRPPPRVGRGAAEALIHPA